MVVYTVKQYLGLHVHVHVAVNNFDFEKNQHFRVRFGEGGGGHSKAYAMYSFINVDNYERPLSISEITC